MDMDFYSNLGSYDSAFNDNLVTSFGGNPANFSINPNNSGSTTSCGLLALNHLARYHSAPTSVLQGLLLDDDDDDDDDGGGGGGDGDLLDISQNSELSRLLNDGIGSFASLIDPPPKPVTLIHGNNTDNNSGTLMNPSTTTTTTTTTTNNNNTATNPSANHNLKLNPPLNHNLKLNPHHHANYVNPPDDHHYNMLSNPANMGAPSLNQDVTNLTNLTNQTLISLNAQMNQSLLNQDRLILNPQISLFNHANNNNLMIPNNSSSSNCSSTNHSPTLSSISEQDPITLNNEESHVISLIPNNITIDQGKQSTQYQNHNPNLHSNPNPNLNTTNLNLHSNPNPNLNTTNLNLHSNPNPNLNTTNLNGNLNPNPNPSVDCLSNLYKTRPPQGPMMMLPNIGNSVKPSGGLIRHSSSPAHFLSKMAMEEMASNGDHELNGMPSSGAYNPHGQRKRGRGGAHELPDKNNMQQHLGQQQMSMSPPLLTSEGLSPPNHVSCFDDIDGSIVDSVLCKARAKRGHATHPRSIAERVRRTKISDRIKKLQDLVPNLDKQANTADMLDEIVEYVKVLQQKIKDLSMDPPMCNCVRQQEQAI